MNTRRKFLLQAPLGLLGAVAACSGDEKQSAAAPPPGAPQAFGTGPLVGPDVSPTTLEEAEKLVQVTMSKTDREQAAKSWRPNYASVYERRTGPRKVPLEPDLAPATRWIPLGTAEHAAQVHERFNRTKADAGPLPAGDDEIAFSPMTKLSRWIETKKLSSERLTRIYLERLTRFDPKLHCVITLCAGPALAQAKKADAEIAAGKYRGPLHGIPWGAKDLLDTAGIATTYGA